jgi:L-histidine N-alpha-methyltransferase
MSITDIETRLTLIETEHEESLDAFADDVREGLQSQRKYLSCRYFYDERGSALFEAICDLPEYYLTRAERQILTQRSDEIASHFDKPTSLIELGSGSAV